LVSVALEIAYGLVDCVKLICGLRLISALVVTPVGAYFLWPSSHGDAGHHGHDEHHEEHHEEAEAKEEEVPQEEESKDEEPEKSDKPSGTEGDSQPRADANKKSSGKEETEERAPTSGPASTEGASGKGQMKNDSEGMNQGSKREPDGKGGFKNRKDSGLQKDLTVDNETVYSTDGKTESVSWRYLNYDHTHCTHS
jgi:ABC-type nickel/cobalt efflux system permease component RcnA